MPGAKGVVIQPVSRFFIVSLLLAAAVPGRAETVGLWTFDDYGVGDTVPVGGAVLDTSGNNRHLRNVSSFGPVGTVRGAALFGGTTAIALSGSNGDNLRFDPGFSAFVNYGGSASSSDFDIGPVGGGCPACKGEWVTMETVVFLPMPDRPAGSEGGVMGKGGSAGGDDHWGMNFIARAGNESGMEGLLVDWIDDPGPYPAGFYRVSKNTWTNIPAGWHHVAFTRNRLTDRMKCYVDYVEFGSEYAETGVKPVPDSPNGNFVVGCRDSDGTTPFRGYIDMVRVTIGNAVLDPSEFWRSPSSTGTVTVIGCWTFEEYAGQATVPAYGMIQDTSGNARHLLDRPGRNVVPGAAPESTALEFSGTLRDFLDFRRGFRGFSNSTTTASESDIVLGRNDSFTIEAVVTLAHDNLYITEGGILGKGNYSVAAGADEWNMIAINDSNNHVNTVQTFLGDGGHPANGFFVKNTGTNIVPGWHHLALVRDTQTDAVSLYVDGILIETQFDQDPSGTMDLGNAAGNFIIGGNNSLPRRPFRGSIDMVRISNDALSPSQFRMSPVDTSGVPAPDSTLPRSAGQ